MLKKHSKRTVRRGCNVCGSTDLYWAHDTSQMGEFCSECSLSGKWVLIEMDGRAHVHNELKSKSGSTSWGRHDPFEDLKKVKAAADEGLKEVKAAAEPKPVSAPSSNGELETVMRMLLDATTQKIDKNEIREMIKDQCQDVIFPTRTVVVNEKNERKEIEGKTHHKVADVLTDLSAGEHVLMVGPAGTGKSTIAEQCAEALSLNFYSISLSPMTAASQILGYMQAEGNYVRTLFREAYENGGIFHFDEFDNGHPSILAVVNAALANGHMPFPDKMVKRHDGFRCVASANTYGRGPDRQYVGRQALDAATLDRFSVETIEIDETLEEDLCHATGLGTRQVERVLRYVRALRESAESQQMTVIISPRASVGMCRLLKAGRPHEAAIEARVRRGMSDQDWSKLTDKVSRF